VCSRAGPITPYALLVVVCPSCGQENPEGFRFCGACAAPLGEAIPAREERKVITVLFCDLVGSTAQGERLDPEDLQALLSRYHGQVRKELEGFGGTMEKFIGDAVVALFGAPIAHEDDPERAVRAAFAVKEWVSEQSDLHVRLAVNTGEALVLVGARASQGEHMASGDVLNTAARLQAAAPVDGVLVGEQTYRATEQAIEYREHPPVEAKGKAEPVRVWEAVQARATYGIDVAQAGAPLVGRGRELGVLAEALARIREERAPQLVTIMGVPGIGKSRLVYELWCNRGHNEHARAHLERALELVRAQPTTVAKAYVMSEASRFGMLTGDHEAALQVGSEALALAEELGLDELRASNLNNIGVVRVESGNEQGVGDLERAVELAPAESWQQWRAALNLAWAGSAMLGDLSRAWERHLESSRIATRSGLEFPVRWERGERVGYAYWLGRWEECERVASEFID
jgi:class 3 adenylate cyclase